MRSTQLPSLCRPPVRAGVYVVQSTHANRIKIGMSSNIADRIEELRRANAAALRFVGWFPGGRLEERALHAELDAYRLHGEWFRAPRAVREFILDRLGPAGSGR